jgi:hypothetical protein
MFPGRERLLEQGASKDETDFHLESGRGARRPHALRRLGGTATSAELGGPDMRPEDDFKINVEIQATGSDRNARLCPSF